jgi:hypothetical protein
MAVPDIHRGRLYRPYAFVGLVTNKPDAATPTTAKSKIMAVPLIEAGRALPGYAALRPPHLPPKPRAGGFPFQSLLRMQRF